MGWKEGTYFFFFPNNEFINFLVKWSPASAVRCSWALTDTDKLFCGIFKQTKVFKLQTSVQTGFLQVSFHVSQNKEVRNHKKNLKGESSWILLSCCTWRCGRGVADLLASVWSFKKKKKKRKESECGWLIKINLALVFFPLGANCLSPFFTVLNHHKHWCCAKKVHASGPVREGSSCLHCDVINQRPAAPPQVTI